MHCATIRFMIPVMFAKYIFFGAQFSSPNTCSVPRPSGVECGQVLVSVGESVLAREGDGRKHRNCVS